MNYVNYEKVKILKMTFSNLPIKLFFYKKIKDLACEWYQSLSKAEKQKVTIWSWMLKKSLRRWKNILVDYRKKYYKMRKKGLS